MATFVKCKFVSLASFDGPHPHFLAKLILGLISVSNTLAQPDLQELEQSQLCQIIPFALETFATRVQGLNCEQVCDHVYKNLGDAIDQFGKRNFIDCCQSSKAVLLQNHGGKEFSSAAEPEAAAGPSNKVPETCFCLVTFYMVTYFEPASTVMPWLTNNHSPENIASRLSGSLDDGSANWIARPFSSNVIVPFPCDEEIWGPPEALSRLEGPVRRTGSRLPPPTEFMGDAWQSSEDVIIVSNVENALQDQMEPLEGNHLGVDLAVALQHLLTTQNIAGNQLVTIATSPQQQNDYLLLSSTTDFSGSGRLSSLAEIRIRANDEAESSSQRESRGYRGLEFDEQTNSWILWNGKATPYDTDMLRFL